MTHPGVSILLDVPAANVVALPAQAPTPQHLNITAPLSWAATPKKCVLGAAIHARHIR